MLQMQLDNYLAVLEVFGSTGKAMKEPQKFAVVLWHLIKMQTIFRLASESSHDL